MTFDAYSEQVWHEKVISSDLSLFCQCFFFSDSVNDLKIWFTHVSSCISLTRLNLIGREFKSHYVFSSELWFVSLNLLNNILVPRTAWFKMYFNTSLTNYTVVVAHAVLISSSLNEKTTLSAWSLFKFVDRYISIVLWRSQLSGIIFRHIISPNRDDPRETVASVRKTAAVKNSSTNM